MLILYHGGGASDFNLHYEPFNPEQWEKVRRTACRLLRERQSDVAANLLEKMPFSLFDATNGFGDEFSVLYATIPFDPYIDLSEKYKEHHAAMAAFALADVLHEVSSRYVRFIAVELDTNPGPVPVATPALQVTSQAVERALEDAEQLIRTRDAISGVDRVHTAFQGYLLAVVRKMGMETERDASMTQLFKIIREKHPAFSGSASKDEEIGRIIRAMATILDALNPIRNRASIAHPNEDLVGESEAMLVINTVRTLLHYLDAKIGIG